MNGRKTFGSEQYIQNCRMLVNGLEYDESDRDEIGMEMYRTK